MPATPKGAPFPAATSANDVPADIQALATWTDGRPGVSPLTTAARDALTGADLWDGRVIYNLTTAQLERYNATLLTPAWQPASIADHGGLTGLGDDDHVQYLLETDNLASLTDKAAARENLGANAAYVAKADQVWQRLAEVRLGTNGAITLSGIPATFRHLRLVVAGRSTNASADDGVFLRFNGDATAVYDWQTLRASGTAVAAAEGIGQTYLDVGRVPAGNAPAGIAGALVVDLPDYAQTATQKTALSSNVNKRDAATGGLDARQHVGAWRNTAAINQVFVAAISGQLLSNTIATLYGTKGS
jgi:hypothetical protein